MIQNATSTETYYTSADVQNMIANNTANLMKRTEDWMYNALNEGIIESSDIKNAVKNLLDYIQQ